MIDTEPVVNGEPQSLSDAAHTHPVIAALVMTLVLAPMLLPLAAHVASCVQTWLEDRRP